MCSLLDIVDTCLDEDLVTFKATVQDLVDELEEMRGQYRLTAHKALVTRLLFIITRCSRLVLTGMPWGASIDHNSICNTASHRHSCNACHWPAQRKWGGTRAARWRCT